MVQFYTAVVRSLLNPSSLTIHHDEFQPMPQSTFVGVLAYAVREFAVHIKHRVIILISRMKMWRRMFACVIHSDNNAEKHRNGWHSQYFLEYNKEKL